MGKMKEIFEQERLKMPYDFWNYPYNPITGYRTDERESWKADCKKYYLENCFNKK